MFIYQCIVVQDPMSTTVCRDNNATFTCVIFIPSGGVAVPGWLRNGSNVNANTMHHITSHNLTQGAVAPVYIQSVLTVTSVRPSDNGVLYQCGFVLLLSNGATLNVLGAGECTCVYTNACFDLMFL